MFFTAGLASAFWPAFTLWVPGARWWGYYICTITWKSHSQELATIGMTLILYIGNMTNDIETVWKRHGAARCWMMKTTIIRIWNERKRLERIHILNDGSEGGVVGGRGGRGEGWGDLWTDTIIGTPIVDRAHEQGKVFDGYNHPSMRRGKEGWWDSPEGDQGQEKQLDNMSVIFTYSDWSNNIHGTQVDWAQCLWKYAHN